MIGSALRTAAWALHAARPYLLIAANAVSLVLTAGDIARGLRYLRHQRTWRTGSRRP